jgi:hypothetical protein
VFCSLDEAIVSARSFLLQAVGSGLRQDNNRQHDGLTFEQADGRASQIESRELLQAVEQALYEIV